MLQLRMQALERQLLEAQDPSKWKDDLDLQNFVVDESLWYIAVEEIAHAAMAQGDAIKAVMNDAAEGRCDEETAWRRYTKIQAESEDIFRECLELLGGLALRDRINDEHVCRFADELIKEQANAVGRMSRFTIPVLIPVLDYSLSSTLRRVATVRFPEWQLWTLPLVAHEYALGLLDENGALLNFAAQLAAEAISFSPPVDGDDADSGEGQSTSDAQVTTGADAAALRERRMRILIADAVATYTTGPAFACAALILRLSPFKTGGDGNPSDEDRAAVILGVLESMSSEKPRPFADIASRLGEYWKESVAAARGTSADTVDLEPPISSKRIVRQLKRTFFRPNIPYTGQEWLQATEWGDAWKRQLEAQKEKLIVPHVQSGSHLRDALNACWYCRVETVSGLTASENPEERVGKIADVGRALCDAIIGVQSLPGAGTFQSARQPQE
jgi:hypothetical protein